MSGVRNPGGTGWSIVPASRGPGDSPHSCSTLQGGRMRNEGACSFLQGSDQYWLPHFPAHPIGQILVPWPSLLQESWEM